MHTRTALGIGVTLVSGLVLSTSLGYASTLPDGGTQIQIQGLNDFVSTIWAYLSGNVGRAAGAGIFLAGLRRYAQNDERRGGTPAMLSGAGVAFVPTTINTLFDAAPAAVAGMASLAVPVWAQVLTGFTAGRVLVDPVALVTLGVLLACVLTRHHRRALRAV